MNLGSLSISARSTYAYSCHGGFFLSTRGGCYIVKSFISPLIHEIRHYQVSGLLLYQPGNTPYAGGEVDLVRTQLTLCRSARVFLLC
jgi:hypothetical protein